MENQLINSNDDPTIFDLVELYNTKMMINQMDELQDDANVMIASIMFAKNMRDAPNKIQHLRLFEILATGGLKNPKMWTEYFHSLESLNLEDYSLIDLQMMDNTLNHMRKVLTSHKQAIELLQQKLKLLIEG